MPCQKETRGMSGTQNHPPRERAIEPPVGPHSAPMPEKPLDATPARQGQPVGHVRWMVIFGIAILIVAFILTYVFVV